MTHNDNKNDKNDKSGGKVDIDRFLNSEGRIVLLPRKQAPRLAVLAYLAEKFEVGRDYNEKEVNQICDQWHSFGDYFLLRRELVDYGLLRRERDGSRYWRPTPAIED